MYKKVLHIVFVLLLVLAIPFSQVVKPVVMKSPVKQDKASPSQEESAAKTFVQPQVFHAPVTSAQAFVPAALDYFRSEIIFPQEAFISSTSLTLLDKGTSKFFKILFRHFIATQAP
jgi:hypothetical protein